MCIRDSCRNGHLDVAKYLVDEKDCDPACKDNDGWTPLHSACRNGHLDIAKYLVDEKDCNPACKTNKLVTPLYLSCSLGHLNVVKYLEEQVYGGSHLVGGTLAVMSVVSTSPSTILLAPVPADNQHAYPNPNQEHNIDEETIFEFHGEYGDSDEMTNKTRDTPIYSDGSKQQGLKETERASQDSHTSKAEQSDDEEECENPIDKQKQWTEKLSGEFLFIDVMLRIDDILSLDNARPT